jgi:hypothetical protein
LSIRIISFIKIEKTLEVWKGDDRGKWKRFIECRAILSLFQDHQTGQDYGAAENEQGITGHFPDPLYPTTAPTRT